MEQILFICQQEILQTINAHHSNLKKFKQPALPPPPDRFYDIAKEHERFACVKLNVFLMVIQKLIGILFN